MNPNELQLGVVYCWCYDEGAASKISASWPTTADDRRFVLTRVDLAANEADFLNTAGPATGATGTFTDLDLLYDAMVAPA